VAQKTPKKTPGKRSGSLLSLQASGFAVMILGLVIAGVVILAPSLRILAEQQQEIAELRQALEIAQQEVVDLEEQRERWSDPAFIETQARERLMFVYPGDITYLVIDDLDDEVDEDDVTISSDIVQSASDWRSSLLASYLVAATTSRVPERAPESAPANPIPAPDLGTEQ
jgi:cell division protein FtsB